MKHFKHFFTVFLLVCTIGVFAQDLTNTEKAIKEVIENETKYYNARDYDGWASTWVHSPNIYWSVAGPKMSMEVKGWDDLSTSTKKYFEENPEPSDGPAQHKTDYEFAANGNMAFVTFLEDGNMSTRVLSKEKGDWKLMRMGVLQTVAYETHQRMQSMHDMAGIWYVDPLTVELSDEKWTLKNLKCKFKPTDIGMKMYMTSDWKGETDFTGTWKEEYIFANDTEAKKVGVMVSTSGPEGSSVHSGECHFKEDHIVVKARKLGASEKSLMKHKMYLKDKDHMKMHYIFLNDNGEKEWEMQFELKKSKDESLAMR